MPRHLRALGALLWLLPLPAGAQTCLSLTGAWQLDPAASQIGPGFSFDPRLSVSAIRLQLRQAPRAITQTWHLTGPAVDETDRFTLPTDGTSHQAAPHSALDSMPVDARAWWENCTLVEIGRATLFGQQILTRTRFVLTPDGLILTLSQHAQSDIGDTSRTLRFRRVS